ncbi:MAG: thioredoxin domain-containing protein [Planctomycetota bacterium]|nr:thioredoxin domain-containing protein [Planctomycetota bacterium]
MRLFLYALAASLVLLQPSYGDEVWSDDYKKAFEAAQKNKKPVLLKFTSTWCGTCTQMQKGPLSDKATQGAIKTLNSVALDVDKFKELTKRYQIKSLPTLLFMSPSGVIFKRTELFVEKDKLDGFLANAQKQSDSIEAKLDALKKTAKRDPEQRSAVAKFFMKHGNLGEAAIIFRASLNDRKIGAHPRQKAGIRVIDSYYRMEQFDKALKAVEDTVKLNPFDPLAAHATFLKGFVYEAKEAFPEAKKVYVELVKSIPKTRAGQAAAKRLKELRDQ